jgi:aminoglycoside phosphotransferase (APT) family kinase protein
MTRTQSAPDPWIADIELSEERAAGLIAQQFPELAPFDVERIGEGWDNTAFSVNGAYVFRFPRRSVSAKLIETEMRVLPRIATRLPLPISTPTLVGMPSSEYPWHFAGYAKLDSVALSSMRLDDGSYPELAATLGRFLRALHSIECAPLSAVGLPPDEIGRFDYVRTLERLRGRVDYLEEIGAIDNAAAIVRFAESLAPIAPRDADLTLTHGDLYARHILVDEEIRPTAIIDWGDVHFGDPAIDLTVAYNVIPPALRDEFFRAYGTADESARRLARYRAIYHSAMVAQYGHRIHDADLVYIGLRGLRISLV